MASSPAHPADVIAPTATPSRRAGTYWSIGSRYRIRNTIRHNLQYFGIWATLYDLIFRAINCVVYYKTLKCLEITTPDPRYLNHGEPYKCLFLDKPMLMGFSKNDGCEMSENFLRHALGKGDECFGILDGDTLASYGWYSNSPTAISSELVLHFSDEYIYMYKGFTRNEYRGQRLHAIGMTVALKEYLSRGFKGLVSYVESTNFSSLKSVYRMGYKDFGKLYILKIFGKYLIHSSRGCREYGFRPERRRVRPR